MWGPSATSQRGFGEAVSELKNSDAYLRAIIDTIPALVWRGLPDGSKEFLNKQWRDYTGLSLEESYGWGWQVAVHPEDLPRIGDKWRELRVEFGTSKDDPMY
jgi:PAS domain-containing protein